MHTAPRAPLVSLIIPTYKRAGRLRAAVESALKAHTHAEELEIVVVDDCSPDETPAVCAQLVAEYPRVRAIRREQNGGLSRARNTGIQEAKGEFLAFLDDDDWRLPGSLDGQIKRLQEHPDAVLCYGPVRFVDDASGEYTGEIYPLELPEGDIFWPLMARCFPQVPSIVVRRALLPPGELFDPEQKLVEDWPAWLRLAEKHPFVAVPEPVAGYRLAQSGSGQLSSNPAAMAVTTFRLQNKLFVELPRAAADGEGRARARRELLAWSVPWLYGRMLEAVGAGNRTGARACWRGLLELSPAFALRRRVLRALLASYIPALAARGGNAA